MAECKWSKCKNERRERSPFCSDACSKRWRRANSDKLPSVKSDSLVPEVAPNPDKPGQNQTRTANPDKPLDYRSMSYDTLRHRINSYEADTWVNSPEFAEVKRRLNSWSLTRLRESGQPIPAWRALRGEAA